MEASNCPEWFLKTMADHEEFMERVQAKHEEFMKLMKDEHQKLIQQSQSAVENPNNINNKDSDSQEQDRDSPSNPRDDVENHSGETAKSDGEDENRTIETALGVTSTSASAVSSMPVTGSASNPVCSLGVTAVPFMAVSSMSVTGSTSSPVCRTSTFGQKTSLVGFGSVSSTQSIPFGQAGSLIGSQPFGSGSQTVLGATSTSTFDSNKTSTFGEQVAHTYGASSTQSVPFVQTGAVIGSQPCGTGSQPTFDATNIFTFGSTRGFGSSAAATRIVAPTYGVPSSQSVPLGQTKPFLGSQPFGTGSQPAFDATNISTFGSTPAFGSPSVVGEIVASTYGATGSQSVPLGRTRPVLGSQPFGKVCQSASDPTNISTFGSVPVFCSSPVFGTVISPAYGASSSQSVSLGHTRPALGSQPFGTDNQSSFGGMRHFLGSQPFSTDGQLSFGGTIIRTFGSTPAFGSLPAFGTVVAPTYSACSSQSVPLGEIRPVFGSQPFDSGNQSAFGGTSTSAFGSMPVFSENVAPTHCSPSPLSVPFGLAGPVLGRQSFGTDSQRAFGATRSQSVPICSGQTVFAQQNGTRVTSYRSTSDGVSPDKIMSISGMPEYESKSHEELRFEDFQLDNKGNQTFSAGIKTAFGATRTSTFGSTSMPAFGKIIAPTCGVPTTQSVAFGHIGPVLGSQPFGATNASAFDSTGTFGEIVASTYSAPNTELVPSCRMVPVVGNQLFGTGSQPRFGAEYTSTFGSTSMPAFGDIVTWIYGVPFIPAFMVLSPGSSAFGTIPDFGSSSTGAFHKNSVVGNNGCPFGSQISAVGAQWLPACYGQTTSVQHGGTRTVSYISTPECDVMNSSERIMSISGMPEYKSKSHEELRLEDYKLGVKGIQM